MPGYQVYRLLGILDDQTLAISGPVFVTDAQAMFHTSNNFLCFSGNSICEWCTGAVPTDAT